MGNIILPHEIYLRTLVGEGLDQEQILRRLEDDDLVAPSQDYFPNLLDNPVKKNSKFDRAIALLDHKDKEFIDALCIVYRHEPKKIQEELIRNVIKINNSVLEEYRILFWHPDAIDSRAKWRRYIRLNRDPETIEILHLAKAKDEELLFWALGKPRKIAEQKKVLEDLINISYIKVLMLRRETSTGGDGLNNSRAAANWATIIHNSMKQLSELETQGQYQEFLEIMKGGVQLESKTKEHKQITEVIQEDAMNDPAEVISINVAKKKKT